MALYDKASLVLIPSQYKEGKLYNIKPLKDSFEFERGSAATRVNSDGLIEYVGIGEELVTNGTFDADSDWARGSNWTISNGVASSDGSTNGQIFQTNVFEPSETYLVTFTVTKTGGTGVIARAYYGSYETILNITESGTYTTSFTPNASTNGTLYFFSSGLFVGSIDNVSIKQISNDTPRLDYSGTEPSLLLEPQRTNLVTHSINFNTYLTNPIDAIMTPNYGIAPDGTTTSTRFQWLDSTAFSYRAYNISTEHTASVYVKGTLGETVMFGFGGNVTVGNVYTFTGDWQRITFNGSSATQFFLSNYGGSTATEFEAWGLQLEQGSYATSYIPTNGQAETRLADVCNNAGDASVFNSEEGVLYGEINPVAVKDQSGYFGLLGTSPTNRIIIGFPVNNNDVTFFVISQGTTVANNSYDIGNMNQYIKVALKYKENDFALWVNGSEVLTDDNGTPNVEISHLGFFGYTTNQPLFAKCKAIAYFPEALTDTELAELTQV